MGGEREATRDSRGSEGEKAMGVLELSCGRDVDCPLVLRELGMGPLRAGWGLGPRQEVSRLVGDGGRREGGFEAQPVVARPLFLSA